MPARCRPKRPPAPLAAHFRAYVALESAGYFCYNSLDSFIYDGRGGETTALKYERWNIARANPAAQARLEAAGLPSLAAAVLAGRGISDAAGAQAYIACASPHSLSPFALRDMEKAVRRILHALAHGERITIYGDYDVDGITATCLLVRFLRSRGASCDYYIPNRIGEGYGLNAGALDELAARGTTLLVTVDCGITAGDMVKYARSLGMDVIITDHHECQPPLPDAAAVVDPHRPDCSYPFKHLAGVGVALKLALALTPESLQRGVFLQYAQLAAIGTVADVVCVTGENRAIVREGVAQLSQTQNVGLRMLIREAGLENKPINSTSVGFALAPRINAAGRMGCASVAAELFLTEDPARAEELAKELCALNRKRQEIEQEIFDDAVLQLAAFPQDERDALVLAGPNWHQGVVGIVASRLACRFACPVFMICLADGRGKGSCRSYGGFNLFGALERASDLLDTFGGHALAAGFVIAEENIPAFRARMNRAVRAYLKGEAAVTVLGVDALLPGPGVLTNENVGALELLEPYGTGNPRPVFALAGMNISSLCEVGDGKHLKLRLGRGGQQLDCIFFSVSAGDAGLHPGDRIDVAFYVQINEFRGRRCVQLQLLDLRAQRPSLQTELGLFDKYRRGDALTACEARLLAPEREDFAALWRYLASERTFSVEETPVQLARHASLAAGRCESVGRTLVCAEVFAERGLITLHRSRGLLSITVSRSREKADLEASVFLQMLRKAAE